MKKPVFSWLSSLLVLVMAFPVLAQDSLSDLTKLVKPAVVTVVAYDRQGKILQQAGGFFVSPRRITSSRYVLRGADRAEIKTSDGKIYAVPGVAAEDVEADIVLLEVDGPARIRPLQVVKTLPASKEKAIVASTPKGAEPTVSEGVVSFIRNMPGFGSIIQVTANVFPGSGYPVVNLKGQVIGVTTSQMPEDYGPLSFAALPGQRVAVLRPGKLRTLAEWNDGVAREKLASTGALFAGGLGFLWSNSFEKAFSLFEKVVEKDPGHAEAYFNLGMTYLQLGDKNSALSEYEVLKKLNPDLAKKLADSINK